MKNKILYPVTDFYVGELYVSYEFGNLLSNKKLNDFEIEERNKINTLSNNGAIAFQERNLSKYIDWDKRRNYEGALTIFYKCGDNYVCLHNGKEYNFSGDDYLKNMYPIINFFPKIDYDIPKFITTSEALVYFNLLFKNSKINLNYINNLHPISDFYVGNLHMNMGYLPDNDHAKMYEYSNLLERYMLYKSNARIGGMFGKRGESSDSYGSVYDSYDYTNFKCLFLDGKQGLLNLNNNTFYNKGIVENREYKDCVLGESHYDYIQPLNEVIKNPENQITIVKALKLFKNIN